ncbi:MAG: hypothetical protein H6592_11330 [Flavobacteriales bacterium]|nr:hypothetical protein [Flavobacteriales bacterium]
MPARMAKQQTDRPQAGTPEPNVENASPDPVEGRTDNELWKRHRPLQEAPARAGADEDVEGAVDPRTMETYEREEGHPPAPGILDTTPDEDRPSDDQIP